MIVENSRTYIGPTYFGSTLIGLLIYVIVAIFSTSVVAQQSTSEEETAPEQIAPVELKSKDGLLSISGNLIGFDGEFYEVQTEIIGKVRLSVNSVDCDGLACPEIVEYGPEFGIYGSRTVGTTLIPNLLKGYAESINATIEIESTDIDAERIVRILNADGTLRAQIDLQTRGSGSAFPALADGVAAIGVADRRIKDSDLEALAAADISDLRDTENETVLGVDGIALITHPDNPVQNLSSLDVARIWSGEVTNWLEFGGGDVPISVNSFGESSGDRAVLLDSLVRPNNSDETVEVTRWSAYQAMVDAVKADRGGIGYVGRWLARTNDVNVLDIRGECGLLSSPTDFRIKIEGYVMSRRLYAYTLPGRIHPEAKAFLDWAQTSDAQPYVKESHFVDHEPERMRLQDMGLMLVHTAAAEPEFNGLQFRDMTQQLRSADRLSLSFRFNSGSSILDVESVRNIEDLAVRMTAGEFDGLELLLVGFADSEGGRIRNTSIALARAQAVQEILSEALDEDTLQKSTVVPLSYGELLPLSCNDTEQGRARNRRVEVWLRTPNTAF